MRKIVLALLLFPGLAMANKQFDALDKITKVCAENAKSTQETNQCLYDAMTRWDSILNTEYKLLMNTQSGDFKTALRDSQRAWIKYRDAYFESVNKYFQQEQGTIWGTIAFDNKMQFVRNKAIEMHNLRISTDVSGESE